MTGVVCPIEGCEYGEDDEKSLEALRGHVNSKTDDEHQWSEVEPLVEAADEDDDQQEAAEEEGEPAETEENDQQEDTDESNDDQQTMPTDEEYEQQQNGGKGGDGDDAETNEETNDDTTDTSTESGGFLPALDGRTMMLLLGVLAVLALIFLVLNRDSSDEAVTTADVTEEGDQDASDSASGDELELIE